MKVGILSIWLAGLMVGRGSATPHEGHVGGSGDGQTVPPSYGGAEASPISQPALAAPSYGGSAKPDDAFPQGTGYKVSAIAVPDAAPSYGSGRGVPPVSPAASATLECPKCPKCPPPEPPMLITDVVSQKCTSFVSVPKIVEVPVPEIVTTTEILTVTEYIVLPQPTGLPEEDEQVCQVVGEEVGEVYIAPSVAGDTAAVGYGDPAAAPSKGGPGYAGNVRGPR